MLSEGEDVTLLTYGTLFGECVGASALLRQAGIAAGLVNMRMPKPPDVDAILRAAGHSKLLVTVEDHFKTGGLFSIVAETLAERGIQAPVMSIALDERWFKPALLADVLVYEGFTAAAIASRIEARLNRTIC
jgi:transketolase